MARQRSATRWALGHGNKKLGPEIWYWSMSPKRTCPKSTRLCRRCCYGDNGEFRQFVHCLRHVRNFDFSKTKDFVPKLSAAILRKAPPTFRFNSLGDYYSLPYIEKWRQICRNCPDTFFFGYARSWRDKRWWPALRELAATPKVNLILSVDHDCAAELSALQGATKLMKVWLAEDNDDLPTCEVDLVFRNNWRKLPPLQGVDHFGAPICPHQTGVEPDAPVATCYKCGYCWRLWKERC